MGRHTPAGRRRTGGASRCSSRAGGTFAPTSTGSAIYWLSPRALASVQAFVESRLGPWAWDDVLLRALLAPAFLALTLLSALLFFLSRPSPPEIGHSSRDR
jgi:hypothetical protein